MNARNLARKPVAVWLGTDGLSVEYGGQTLSSYDVSLSEDTKLREVTNPGLFVTRYRTPQPRLFGLDELGEDGWLRALELDEYAARSQNGPESIRGCCFPTWIPVAHIAIVRSPRLNRGTLCRTERHNY
jgi:hypothetical protein